MAAITSRRATVIAGTVFLFALAVRLIFIWQWNATPFGAKPIFDADTYDKLAQNIANGQLLRAAAFYMSPLYPYVLALIYKMFGHSFLAASLFNALLGALSCAVLSLIALDCFGLPAALLTGALAAADRQLIFYTAPIMKESLGFFLMTLFLAAVLRALRSGRTKYFFLSGALLGLLALVRGNAVLLAPVILLLAYMKHPPGCAFRAEKTKIQSLNGCAAFAIATILFIAPATLHNAIVSADFVLINYDGGFNLYMANSPSATGSIAAVPEEAGGVMRETSSNEEEGTTHYAEQVRGRTLKPSEVSAFWRDKALAFIVQNPWRTLSLLLKKFCLFWNAGELPDKYNYSATFFTETFPTILSLPLPGLWLVSAAAAFALAGFWRKREEVAALLILAAVYLLSVLPFCVSDRLRQPIEVFLLPLAGAAWPCAWDLARQRRWGRLMAATACAVLVLAVGSLPAPPYPGGDPENDAILGAMYGDMGNYRDSLLWLRKGALAGNAHAQNALGGMYHEGQGVPPDYAQAMQWVRKAAEQGLTTAQYNLGKMYLEGQGVPPDSAQAMQWFRKAAEQGQAEAQESLGEMDYKGEGVPQDYAQALQWFRKAADRGDPDAQNYLGTMYHAGQDVPQDDVQAAQWFRIAAEHGNAKAQFNLGVMYYQGQGVPRDTAQAVQWFHKAAEQGNPSALNNLSILSHAGAAGP